MPPSRLDLCISQGTDTRLVLAFTQDDGSGTPVDFTGAVAASQFRTSPTAIAAFSFDVSIDESPLAANEIALSLKSVFLESIEPRDYFYDLKIAFLDGQIWTPIEGTLSVLPNITKVALP